MKKPRNASAYCPLHQEELLRPVKYQKWLQVNGKKKIKWFALKDWRICEKCKVPVRIEITIRVVETA